MTNHSNELTCYQARYQQLQRDQATLRRITQTLRQKGYTLQQLADTIGVNRSTIHRWEREGQPCTSNYQNKPSQR